MAEAIEAIEGCIAVLEAMEEERHDPRHYALMAALRWAVDALDATRQGE